jgi:DNA polymerase-3 subunit delta'
MTDNWGVLGHEWAVDLLRHHVAGGNARHAYLFTGPAGVGRRTLALRFAQALNCPERIAPGEPCGTCRDCRQMLAQQHPDLRIVQPEDNEHRPVEAGTLKIEQVRELRATFHLKPFTAPYRIALFLRFQEANDQASNALLKTLEEAPAHAVVMLTADDPEALLPTVVSRCEVVRLRPLPTSAIASALQGRGLEASRVALIAHLSGGRPGYAIRLAEDPNLLQSREERLNDLQMLLPSSRVAKFAYAEKLSKDKSALRQTVLVWLSYWRDVLLRVARADAPITNVDRGTEIEAIARRSELTGTRRFVRRLERALEQLERNVNARLLTEALLLDLPR